MQKKTVVQTLLFALAPFMLAGAQTSPDTGRDIAQKSQVTQFTYKTMTVSGEMTLSRGSESIGQRAIAVELIEHDGADAYDQARITINAPTALKDTRLLSWSSGKGEDQQWLVTPRTGRVQRIADRGRQAAFVSSDFSYEDILKWQIDDYDYVRAGQGACPAGACVIVDAKPRNRFSSYTLLKVYYDEAYRISKIEYFANGGEKPRKTLVHSGYVRQGATWQPSRSRMTDHETETATEIVWSAYGIDAPIDERIMSPSTSGR
jgi:Outer membrane lipoprotein-sorting protein